MLDFFLSSVRKEPHLGLKRTFKSNCDAPNHTRRFLEPPGPFVTIPAFLIPSSPGNNYFLPLPVPFCAKRQSGAGAEAMNFAMVSLNLFQ